MKYVIYLHLYLQNGFYVRPNYQSFNDTEFLVIRIQRISRLTIRMDRVETSAAGGVIKMNVSQTPLGSCNVCLPLFNGH